MAPHSMARPTRARGRVLTFAFLLAVVTYLDRICISAAAPFIMEDLHLTVLEMSAVFSAFTLAYSIFEMPLLAKPIDFDTSNSTQKFVFVSASYCFT